MRIILNDIVQKSNAPSFLKSPSLADDGVVSSLTITFDKSYTFDAIGVGNTEASSITVGGQTIALDASEKNGLYPLSAPITGTSVTLNCSERVGRVALGTMRSLGASPAREPGFWSTAQTRTTLSGQVIPGVGGITGRSIQVDFRYKVTQAIFDDIQEAFPLQIGRGYPFFIDFLDCSSDRYPWKRLYAYTDQKWVFQSSVNYSLYSKKIQFTEAF